MSNVEGTPNPQDMSIEKELGLVVKVCPQCSSRNLPSSQYCFQCGAKLPEAPVPDKKICPGCRTVNAPTSQYCYKCGLKLPDTIAPASVVVNPAGFWVRLGAYLIDALILAIPTLLLEFTLIPGIFSGEMSDLSLLNSSSYWIVIAVSIILEIGYYTICIGNWGKTVGKLLMRIKVVRRDGARVTYWRAFARFWSYSLCWLTWGIGFLVIAWNKQKRGLHDFVCDTMVIRV
jgi:uncharacterized RDD family membrane protein YckC/ribosomal protein L40E